MAKILVIDSDGTNLGQKSFEEAKALADSQDMDLKLVSKEKNVYRILDEGKLKYERKQRLKKQRAQQRHNKIKEIQMRPTIADGDLDIKLRHVKEFLEEGLKTKLVMKFKARQHMYKNAGLSKVNSIVNSLVTEGLATVDNPPRFEGKNITVFLSPANNT